MNERMNEGRSERMNEKKKKQERNGWIKQRMEQNKLNEPAKLASKPANKQTNKQTRTN